MKNLILLIVAVFIAIGCKTTKHQGDKKKSVLQKTTREYKPIEVFKADTSKYVTYNFIQNKSKYLHQPLSVFTNDVNINILSYGLASDSKDKKIYTGMYLYIFSYATQQQKIAQHQDPIQLFIDFERPIDAQTAVEGYRLDDGVWKGESKKFYEKQIIKDLSIVKYNTENQ